MVNKRWFVAVWAVLLTVCIFLSWQIHTIGYMVIKWYTPLFYYTLIFVTLILLLLKYAKVFNKPRKTVINYVVLIGSVYFAVSAIEVFLRVTQIGITYYEREKGGFVSAYSCNDKTWFHTWLPNSKHMLRASEFSYPRTTNSLGYSDIEPRLNKDTNEIRIMTIGDSFTEGDGAPFDSSYPQLLKSIIQSNHPSANLSLINAGACGSDLYYDYTAYKLGLEKYKPDVVFFMVSTSDLKDIFCRGGKERFKPDGTVSYKKAPWPEPIVAVSVVSRILFIPFYNRGFIPRWGYKKQLASEIERITRLMQELNDMAKASGSRIVILLKPEIQECRAGKYEPDYTPIIEAGDILSNVRVCNLLSYYNNSNACGDNAYKYYWRINKHHNSNGYKLMAEGAYATIAPVIDTIYRQKN